MTRTKFTRVLLGSYLNNRADQLDKHPEYRVEYRGVVNDEQTEQREALLDFGLGVAAASQSMA
jgi:hypothetical protein